MRKRNALVRVVIWTFIAVLLIALLVMGLGGGLSFAGNGGWGLSMFSSYNYADAEEYTPGGTSLGGNYSEIDISWVSGSVRVEVYDGDTVTFSEKASRELNDDEVLQYRVKGNKLSIQFCAAKKTMFGRSLNKELTVRIPSWMALKTLDLDNVSNSLFVAGGGMSLSELAIETVSGSVTVENIIAEKLDVSGVSGSLDVAGAFEKIDAETVSGSQHFALADTPRQVEVDSVSGSIYVRLAQKAGLTAKLDTVSGSLSSNFASVNGKRAEYEGGGAQFEFETVSGSASLDYDVSVSAVENVTPRATASATPKATATPTASPSPKPERDGAVSGGQRTF